MIEHKRRHAYEKYPVKDSALLMTSADIFFRTFEQAAKIRSLGCLNCLSGVSRTVLPVCRFHSRVPTKAPAHAALQGLRR